MTDREQTENYHTIADVAALLNITEDKVLQAGARGLLPMSIYWPDAIILKAKRYDADRKEFVDEGTTALTEFVPVHRETIGWIWRSGEGKFQSPNGQVKKGDESIDVSFDLEMALLVRSTNEDPLVHDIVLVKQSLHVADSDLAKWAPTAPSITRLQNELAAAKARIAELEAELAAIETGGIQVKDREAPLLDAAIALYRAVAGNPLPAGRTPAQALSDKAAEMYPDLKPTTREHLTIVTNWNDERGRKKK